MAYTTINTGLLERVAASMEDADIAKILGIRLHHDLSDLPKLLRIRDYNRERLVEILEDEVYRLETAMIRVAEDVMRNSVNNDIQMKVGYNVLNTRFGDAGLDVKVEYLPEGVAFYVTANYFVGKEGRGNATNKDLRYLQNVFVDPSTIPLDSVGGLTITRYGSSVIRPLKEAEGLPRTLGEQMKATHVLQIPYGATIPTGMLPSVYEKHKGG